MEKYGDEKARRLMGVLVGDVVSMRWLANYYRRIEIDEDYMHFYYCLAIENGDIKAMRDYGDYFRSIGDVEMAQKYGVSMYGRVVSWFVPVVATTRIDKYYAYMSSKV